MIDTDEAYCIINQPACCTHTHIPLLSPLGPPTHPSTHRPPFFEPPHAHPSPPPLVGTMDADLSFAQTVLSWSPSQLRAGARRPANPGHRPINPDGALPVTFSSPEHYYASLSDGVLEEAWGAIQQSMRAVGESGWVTGELAAVQTSTHTGNPSVLSFKPHQGQWPQGLLNAFANTVIEMEWEGWAGGHVGGFLALCGVHGDGRLLRAKVVLTTAQLRELSSSCAQTPAGGWRLRTLNCSVVTHQRMCDALASVPDVPFMPSLLQGIGGSGGDAPWMASVALGSNSDHHAVTALNMSQQAAVKAFLSAGPGELHLLQGPPGTGKTSTLSALLQALAAQGKRCLVCAPSNKAVQVLAERLMRDIEAGGKGSVAVAMVTADEKGQADSKYLREIGTTTWGRAMAAKIGAVCEQLKPLVEGVEGAGPILIGAQSTLTALQKDIRRAAPTFDNKLSITKGLKGVVDSLAKLNSTIKTAPKPSSKPKRRSSKDKIDESEPSSSPLPMGPTVTDAMATLAQLQAACETGPEEAELLNHATVVFGTLAVLGRTSVRTVMRAVDVLVVDEAAQSTEAETCIAFQYKPQRCLLVGDIKQLPATVLSREAMRRGYGRSLMQRLAEGCKYPHPRLRVQYRMNAAIRRWPGVRFYDGQLTDAPSVLGSHRAAPWHSEAYLGPYAFIDCSEGQERRQGSSYANDVEAHECVSILRHLHGMHGVDVQARAVVITFYQGQVEAIRAAASEAYWGGAEVSLRVHTVDSFQGCEADVVLVSMVRANKKEAVGFLNDFRRLNVALTRARYSLIVLGHSPTMLSVAGSDLQALVQDAQTQGVVHMAKQVQTAIKHERRSSKSKALSHSQSLDGSNGASTSEPAVADEEVDDWEQLAD